ncbi:hypothetical protein Pelo_6640 [Pelomyxa schiedti]|nr:hypothetical protein Pelo_6640 [Pelomyxa schiedti]
MEPAAHSAMLHIEAASIIKDTSPRVTTGESNASADDRYPIKSNHQVKKPGKGFPQMIRYSFRPTSMSHLGASRYPQGRFLPVIPNWFAFELPITAID